MQCTGALLRPRKLPQATWWLTPYWQLPGVLDRLQVGVAAGQSVLELQPVKQRSLLQITPCPVRPALHCELVVQAQPDGFRRAGGDAAVRGRLAALVRVPQS